MDKRATAAVHKMKSSARSWKCLSLASYSTRKISAPPPRPKFDHPSSLHSHIKLVDLNSGPDTPASLTILVKKSRQGRQPATRLTGAKNARRDLSPIPFLGQLHRPWPALRPYNYGIRHRSEAGGGSGSFSLCADARRPEGTIRVVNSSTLKSGPSADLSVARELFEVRIILSHYKFSF